MKGGIRGEVGPSGDLGPGFLNCGEFEDEKAALVGGGSYARRD